MCVDRLMEDMCRHNLKWLYYKKKINQLHIYSQTFQYPVHSVLCKIGQKEGRPVSFGPKRDVQVEDSSFI